MEFTRPHWKFPRYELKTSAMNMKYICTFCSEHCSGSVFPGRNNKDFFQIQGESIILSRNTSLWSRIYDICNNRINSCTCNCHSCSHHWRECDKPYFQYSHIKNSAPGPDRRVFWDQLILRWYIQVIISYCWGGSSPDIR